MLIMDVVLSTICKVAFIGGGSRRTPRAAKTCRMLLTNFFTYAVTNILPHER